MGGGSCLQGYYSSRGLAVLRTVMDGDCGIDVACQILGLLQTIAQRAVLREDIRDYLLARLKNALDARTHGDAARSGPR